MGRDDDLKELDDRLQESDRLAITAIQGMGGIGKTELSLQYAYRSLAQDHYPGGVCWLRSSQDVGIQIVSFARTHLDLSPPIDLEMLQQVAYCWSHWREGTALLIWDDVTDYAAILPYLPPRGDRFKVLLTTRLDLGAAVRQLRLEVLSEAAALELLRSIISAARIEAQLAAAKALCQWVGCLPLGLELVARYLERKKDLSIAKLLQRLDAKRLDAQALKQAEPGMTATLGVTAAFELSWEILSESAQQLAVLLSLFALAPIPRELVEACLPEWEAEDLEDMRDKALLGLHLLQRSDQGLYQLHQLLREFFAVKLQGMAIEEELKRSVAMTLTEVAQRIPDAVTLTIIADVKLAIPHLAAATDFSRYLPDADADWLFIGLGRFYKEQSLWQDADRWFTACLEMTEQRFGREHPDVATSLNNLAALYRSQGRYSEAEPLLVRSLSMRETQLGTKHPDVATSLNNLALLYESQGRYSEVEPLYMRSLSIWETQLGTEHLDVATSLNNLAALYRSQGRYSEAEPLYMRSLSIWETQLGTEHSHVATSLNNLAELYRSQGRYSEAEPLYMRSLSIMETQLGTEHPDVAQSLNNLAELYRSQGRYSEAEPLLVRSLLIRETQLGTEHPHVATSLNNLANLYLSQGRYSEAEPLYLRAIAILFDRLGETHPNTQTGWRNFVGCLQQAIESGQAAQLSDHPATQKILKQIQPGEL